MKLGSVLNKSIHVPPETSDALILTHAKVGVEVELEGWTGDNPFTWWENHNDDSLRNNGQEFTTRGGLSGKILVEAIQELTKTATKLKWREGYPRAAIHIHLDVTDLDVESGQLATLISMYMLVEHAMFGFAGEWRRSCGFCDPLEESTQDFNVLGRALYDTTGKELKHLLAAETTSKYQAVNMLSLGKFGTLEFRQLPTTFEYERILAWINIIMQLKLAATKYDNKMPLIARFSREGATAFVKGILGDMWEALEPYFQEHKAWNAIDNAMALMSYGRILVPKSSEEDVWAEDYNTPAAFVKSKIAKLSKLKKSKPAAAAHPADPRERFYFDGSRVRQASLQALTMHGYLPTLSLDGREIWTMSTGAQQFADWDRRNNAGQGDARATETEPWAGRIADENPFRTPALRIRRNTGGNA